jgi:general secretion pathway protein L
MASTILGIDLGSYAVKVARIEAGFRSAQLVGIFEARVPGPDPVAPPVVDASIAAAGEGGTAGRAAESAAISDPAHDDASLLERQLRALSLLLAEIKPKGETTIVALAQGVTLRLLDLPLSDPKKVQLALPFELAGQLMTDLDDQVVDQTLISVGSPQPGGGEAPSQWVAACAPRDELRWTLQSLLARKIEPRRVGALALATAPLFITPPKVRSKGSADTQGLGPPMPLWVIDIGHRFTHICAVASHPSRPGQVVVPFVRTIARGGLQLTQAVARAHDLHLTRAEMLKHEYGLDESADEKTATALRAAMKPLIRELRQTLSAYSARMGEAPRVVYLCGGTSEMRGLFELLQNELDLEVLPLVPPPRAPWFGSRDGPTPTLAAMSASLSIDTATLAKMRMPSFALLRRFCAGAPAVGLALAEVNAGLAPQVNFRKGEFAFRTDYAFLRERAPYLVGFFVALLLCVGGWVSAQMHLLEKESERLRQRLSSETTSLFGEAKTDGAAVTAELNSALQQDKGADRRIPQSSALDLLEDISRSAPDSKDGGSSRLDVVELHVKPKKIDLKATAASAQYVEDFAAALAKLSCVKGVQKGKVLTVKNTGSDGKPIEAKQFSFELTTTCP